MTLKDLIRGIDTIEVHADLNMDVGCPRYDSRTVERTDVFVAIPGFEQDGNSFIPDAMARGAAVCITQTVAPLGVPHILVKSARRALSAISANYFGHPAESIKIIGVTGTNGKTTITYLIKNALERTAGAKIGLIGTLGNMIGNALLPTERTTPESFDLQRLLRQMVDAGCEYAVMEVSSHALALERAAYIPFEAGIFTNLTQDHLDFHGTMENYLEAKALLFSVSKIGIINSDDPAGSYLLENARCRTVTYSASGAPADYRAGSPSLFSDRVSYLASTPLGTADVEVPVPGHFNIANSLAVLACCCELGIPLRKAADALGRASGIPGRMEVVPGTGDFTVLIDYAHTPDALENVLVAVRKFSQGRVNVLFGCGGDRDRSKRPIMGEIGVRLSDHAYITSDNPRTESPEAIISDILSGITYPADRYTVICNRREAIKRAVLDARRGDILILAGKGHETYQILGKEKTHLDEREEVATALSVRYK